jgi:Uncharacterized protein conserved in bacteria (DUF2188)
LRSGGYASFVNAEESMAKGFIHTVYKGGRWINEVEGGAAIRGGFATKAEATAAGRNRARRDKTEHLIHNKDGQISQRNSYGKDPAKRPG